MGTEDWILKRMDNSYQKANIQNLEWRLDSQNYNIKKKKTKSQKLLEKIYIYKICFKNRVFWGAR